MKIQEILRKKRTGIEKILQIGEIPYPEIMSMNPLPEIRNMKILLEMTRMKIHQIDEMMRMKMAGIQKIFEIQIGEIPYPETRNIVENSHPETKNMMILPEMTRMKIHPKAEMMIKMAGMKRYVQLVQSFARGMKL